MVDMRTTYLGLTLKNPLVVSASPLSEKVDTVQRLENAGAAAVVMYSLFEEQIIHESLELDHYLSRHTHAYAEALTYLPDVGRYSIGPEVYVEHLRRLKDSVSIPIIGSLNGVSSGGWIDYAKKIEDAGADALELNIYYLPFDTELTSPELEASYLALVSDIRTRVQIPVAVKLGPYFTGLAHMAKRFAEAGADGLVLFNRFYQPDLDIEALEVVSNLQLSTSSELRLPLRWIALLYGHVDVDFALTTGVHDHVDMIKGVMAGASVTMTASELLQKGPERASEMLAEMEQWLEAHEYTSVQQMKGSMSAKSVGEPTALRRTNYMKELSSYNSLP